MQNHIEKNESGKQNLTKAVTGPLRAIETSYGAGWFVVTDDQTMIAQTMEQSANLTHEQSKANADLFAAAPEMLRALYDVLETLKYYGEDNAVATTAAYRIGKVIALAEGRAS